jgi:hypothetical protein
MNALANNSKNPNSLFSHEYLQKIKAIQDWESKKWKTLQSPLFKKDAGYLGKDFNKNPFDPKNS